MSARKSDATRMKVLSLYFFSKGMSQKAIARSCNVGATSVRRWVGEAKEKIDSGEWTLEYIREQSVAEGLLADGEVPVETHEINGVEYVNTITPKIPAWLSYAPEEAYKVGRMLNSMLAKKFEMFSMCRNIKEVCMLSNAINNTVKSKSMVDSWQY